MKVHASGVISHKAYSGWPLSKHFNPAKVLQIDFAISFKIVSKHCDLEQTLLHEFNFHQNDLRFLNFEPNVSMKFKLLIDLEEKIAYLRFYNL